MVLEYHIHSLKLPLHLFIYLITHSYLNHPFTKKSQKFTISNPLFSRKKTKMASDLPPKNLQNGALYFTPLQDHEIDIPNHFDSENSPPLSSDFPKVHLCENDRLYIPSDPFDDPFIPFGSINYLEFNNIVSSSHLSQESDQTSLGSNEEKFSVVKQALF